MVADLMPEVGYLPDDGFVVAFGNDAEIVAAADARPMPTPPPPTIKGKSLEFGAP